MTSIVKIPSMQRKEYDRLLLENHLSRIAFTKDNRAYIAPFLYVFDGKRLYFLPTRYGKKMDFFKTNPHVSVEVEDVAHDMSYYRFVTLSGRLEEVVHPEKKHEVRRMFADLIENRTLSENALNALGIDSHEPVTEILNSNRSMVWALTGVDSITALKDTN